MRRSQSSPAGSGRFSSLFRAGAALAVVAILAIAALRLPMPLLVMEPGPTTDVAKLVQIKSPTFESRGSFLLTTVLVSSTEGVTFANAVAALFDGNKDLVSRESIFPSNSSRVNTERIHTAQMSESQQVAAVAALHELGMASTPEGAFIRSVDPRAPAASKLRPGDVIVAVQGRPVLDPAGLQRAIGARRAGDEVAVSVRRDGAVQELQVQTKPAEAGKPDGKTRLGVLVTPQHKLPVDISIDAGNIGGPSAGLVFALAIYDALTPGDLTRGRRIAGTGGIVNLKDRHGTVTSVGAVAEKVTAAGRKRVDVFVVPKSHAEEARSAAPKGLKILPVASLHEAIQGLAR